MRKLRGFLVVLLFALAVTLVFVFTDGSKADEKIEEEPTEQKGGSIEVEVISPQEGDSDREEQ
ncbi:hypothetical protein ACFOGI_11055 [Virgibacillus xinjiangensis]|uniref:Uncharacterized protein n=1 Tax=Virgibacillus xinjiangensis TaxID=393090 RepID=A0ABV7CWP8_9BACI